jgi:hypothetical protein
MANSGSGSAFVTGSGTYTSSYSGAIDGFDFFHTDGGNPWCNSREQEMMSTLAGRA